MKTAVLIDLDYQLNPVDTCYTAWKILQQCFVDMGFCLQERLFIIAQPHGKGAQLAREALQKAEHRLRSLGMELGNVLEACSTFEYNALFHLQAPQPSTRGIEVDFMDTGAFSAWQAGPCAR